MKSAIKRSGDSRTAAQANAEGQGTAARAEFPVREEKWDYMMAAHIDKLDGSAEVRANALPLMEGEEAATFLAELQSTSKGDPLPPCSCLERLERVTENPHLPVVRGGVCMGCGCAR